MMSSFFNTRQRTYKRGHHLLHAECFPASKATSPLLISSSTKSRFHGASSQDMVCLRI